MIDLTQEKIKKIVNKEFNEAFSVDNIYTTPHIIGYLEAINMVTEGKYIDIILPKLLRLLDFHETQVERGKHNAKL